MQSDKNRYISLGIYICKAMVLEHHLTNQLYMLCKIRHICFNSTKFVFSLTCNDHPSLINLKVDYTLRNIYIHKRLSCHNNYGNIFFSHDGSVRISSCHLKSTAAVII